MSDLSSPGNGERVRCIPPVTTGQFTVAKLLADGLTFAEIAAHLRKSERVINYHAQMLAERIPGDLPRQAKIIAWFRGASRHVLEGDPSAALRTMLSDGQG